MEVVVVGAGQAGLTAAYHLRRAGLEPGTGFVVLDDATRAGGAWQHRWESLTMREAHGVHSLPGMPAPEAQDDAPAAGVIPEYFAAYEDRYGLAVRRPVRVRSVTAVEEDLLEVRTDQGTWHARGLINATGTWQRPFWPAYPGRETFRGRQLHTRDYRAAGDFAGEHVVVVGGGTSAVQLLLEIAPVAETTWVTRREPSFDEGDFDEETRRAAVARVAERTAAGLPPQSVVAATGLPLTEAYRRGIETGVLRRLPMFERIVPDGVRWAAADVPPAPEHQRADTILWATGFRPALDHLAPLRLRGPGGGIVLDGTEVVVDPRVQLVGYGPSASTIGANRAGRQAVRSLRLRLGF
ncbi:NAD(P)/FAD-dependent oxidoreductase [Actinotalea sp. BY-33]|uniref:NAD(P)/FAD-dependent oxidoreductase n=1 Tax=Actinotalea soli TaxID=2819234 RepID=A0A939LS41_9CELL|nr:NAD(P)-binding domain-containing protein [Actinotalea soli]MBO1753073.1 NAD(P)/FAD-dependent oxidoreductase [Actinotalea soli]